MINIINRTCPVGSKWLYYKIYCGVKTADTLLLEVLKPLTKNLLEQEIINKWFFIRYSDPKLHLRFRVELIDLKNNYEVIQTIKTILTPYINNHQIWDIQIANYKRELERYGAKTIEVAELFFFYDSCQILSIIKNSLNDEIRFLKLFKWLELIIVSFNLEKEIVLSFLNKHQEQFKIEFGVNKITRKQLSNKYRKLESQIFNQKNKDFIYEKDLKNIVERVLMLNMEDKLEIPITNLLTSFIHMSINRCFRSKQRLYEMMLYDFLYRKYKSIYIRYENK